MLCGNAWCVVKSQETLSLFFTLLRSSSENFFVKSRKKDTGGKDLN